jgi:hypothetical protein
LTTDWYANQLTHPYYDAKAIDMYATPNDYRYERMGWNYVIPMSDTIVDAETALRSLYASDPTQIGAPYVTYGNVFFPTDSVATFKHFNMTPKRVDYDIIAPYYADPTVSLTESGHGMSLYRVLALDMLSNSISNGWNRPMYFATTVPSSQYQGFTPYLSSTGMAYEVTPFPNAPVSVNVEKAYENILGKFRWGGLDAKGAEGLYLDETVRRMAASTRSGVYTTIEELMASGELPASKWAQDHAVKAGETVPETRYDMALRLLDLLQEKIPASLVPYDGMLGVYFARDYYELYCVSGDAKLLDKAEKLLDNDAKRYAQLIKYATSLSQSNLNALGRSETYALQYLNTVLALKNRIALIRKLPEDSELHEQLLVRPEFEIDLRLAPMIYIDNVDLATIAKHKDSFSGSEAYVLQEAELLLNAHKAAGIDTHAYTNQLAKQYNIDLNRWLHLINY